MPGNHSPGNPHTESELTPAPDGTGVVKVKKHLTWSQVVKPCSSVSGSHSLGVASHLSSLMERLTRRETELPTQIANITLPATR